MAYQKKEEIGCPASVNGYECFIRPPGSHGSYSSESSVKWYDDGNQIICQVSRSGWLAAIAWSVALGPGLALAWWLKAPILVDIVQNFWGQAVCSLLIVVGFAGFFQSLHHHRCITFDFDTGTIHFFSRSIPAVDYNLPMEQVVKLRVYSTTHVRSMHDTAPREYKSFGVELLLTDEEPIRVFEILSEPKVLGFTNFLSRMSGKPVEYSEVPVE